MRGARLPFRTTTAMGLTTRAEDERGGDRRAAGRRSVGIPERAARSRTRHETNGKTTAADQYRRTRRRARCDRTVRGASSRSPTRLLIMVSSPPSPTCARRPVARRPGLRRERGPLRLLPRPHDAPALPWRCLAPRTFRAGCADSAPRPLEAASGDGSGGCGAVGRSSLRVRVVEQRVRPPPLLESTTPPPRELCGPHSSVVRAEEQLWSVGQILCRAARIGAGHRLENPKRRHGCSVILADGLTTCRTADEVRNELIAKSTLVVHGPAPFHSHVHRQESLAVCPHTLAISRALLCSLSRQQEIGLPARCQGLTNCFERHPTRL